VREDQTLFRERKNRVFDEELREEEVSEPYNVLGVI
jgi:hypothetical protein